MSVEVGGYFESVRYVGGFQFPSLHCLLTYRPWPCDRLPCQQWVLSKSCMQCDGLHVMDIPIHESIRAAMQANGKVHFSDGRPHLSITIEVTTIRLARDLAALRFQETRCVVRVFLWHFGIWLVLLFVQLTGGGKGLGSML